MLVSAEIGTKKRRAAYRRALETVVTQIAWYTRRPRVAFWPSFSDPCLQAADYSLWAVCRYWERGDDRSRKLIQHLVASEYDLWTEETTPYY